MESEIRDWYTKSAQTIQVKSQVQWQEEGERCTSYFFKRYKKRKDSSDISQIPAEESRTSQEIICQFYKQLFNNNSEDIKKDIDSFLDITLPQLSSEAKDKLSKPITNDEVATVIQSVKSQSAPGPDGVPYKWYQTNMDVLAGPLVKLFNQVLENGEAPPTWRKTFIKLIPKGGKNLEMVSNWRLIALINCNAKLFSRVLTNRLSSFVHTIISLVQEGFIHNKWIAHAAFDIMTTQEVLSKQKNSTAMLFMDQQKAYDRVDHRYLEAVLKKFACPENLQKAVTALYHKNTTQILSAEGPLRQISVKTGVRQGDPLSPYLFNLSIEPLVHHLQEKLQGLTLTRSTFKMQLFADNVTVGLQKYDEKAFIET
ncbi:MAG TPA: reverse transcriptase family protein [Chlamydiales bacterium]|nr:reverse transcriptase family protein [Chlamydiales bacterium]